MIVAIGWCGAFCEGWWWWCFIDFCLSFNWLETCGRKVPGTLNLECKFRRLEIGLGSGGYGGKREVWF